MRTKKIITKIAAILFSITMLICYSTDLLSAIPIEEIDSNSLIHRNTLIFNNKISSNISVNKLAGPTPIIVNHKHIEGYGNTKEVFFQTPPTDSDILEVFYDYVGSFNNKEVGLKLQISNIKYKNSPMYEDSIEPYTKFLFKTEIYGGITQINIESCDYHISFFERGKPSNEINIKGAYITFGSLNYVQYPNEPAWPETIAPLTHISKAYTLPRQGSSVNTNIISETINGIEYFHAVSNDGFVDQLGHPNFPANAVSFDYSGDIGFRTITGQGALWFTFDTAPLTLTEPENPKKSSIINTSRNK